MLPEGWVLNIRELRGQHALELEIASPLSGMMISRIREYEERWA